MKPGFKSFLVYRMLKPIEMGLEDLQDKLAELPAGDPAIGQMSRSGFIEPIQGNDELLIKLPQGFMLTLQTATRVVPGKIVKRELNKLCKDWENKYERVPTGGEKQELKNQVISEMMRVALIDYTRMMAIVTTSGYIYIDTTSVKRAELFLAALRRQVGTLPVLPLATEDPPSLHFTKWVAGSEIPAQLHLGEGFTAKGKQEGTQTLSGKNVDLDQSTLSEILEKDYQIVSLGLKYYDYQLHGTVFFTLNEQLQFKSLSWPEALVDMAEDEAGEDETGINHAKATLTLTAAALEELRDGVTASLGGESAVSDGEKADSLKQGLDTNGSRPVWKIEAWKLGDTNLNTDFVLTKEGLEGSDEEDLV